MEEPVVIVGVTGNVGNRVANKLAAQGVRVRGVARDPSRGGSGLELLKADLTDRRQTEEALEGAGAVYLTLPESGEDPLGLERSVAANVVEVARRQGVRHLVLHTALQSDKGGTGIGILDNKYSIEATVEASGVPYTILRPGWFMQNLFLAKPYLEQGFFSLPVPPERRIGGVSVEDIATTAVGFLQHGPAYRGFDLHVEGGVTGATLADAAGRVLGRPVQYVEHTGPAREFAEPFPISARHKDLYGELFEYFRSQDYLGDPTQVTAALPGFRYSNPETFMRTELFPTA